MKTFLPYIYGVLLYLMHTCTAFSHPVDSLVILVDAWDSNTDSKFVEVSDNLSKMQMEGEEWMVAKKEFERLLENTQDEANYYKLSVVTALLGTIHIKLNANEEAMQLLQTSITVGNNLLSKAEQIEVLKSIAELALTMGQYDEAYHQRLQILKAYEQLEDKKGIYATLYNIGSIFSIKRIFLRL